MQGHCHAFAVQTATDSLIKASNSVGKPRVVSKGLVFESVHRSRSALSVFLCKKLSLWCNVLNCQLICLSPSERTCSVADRIVGHRGKYQEERVNRCTGGQ